VVHAAVADDHRLVDPLGRHAGLAADLGHVLVEQPHDPRGELAEVAGIELGEGDARHEVTAEDRLGVEAGDRGQLLTRFQLEQRGDHRGGADVDGQAELHAGGVAALDGQDVPRAGGHGDGAVLFAQGRGQAGQHAGADVPGGEPHGRHQLLDIGRLVMLLARERDLDDLLGDAGVEGEAGRAGQAGSGS
jgi:hypothetical protein